MFLTAEEVTALTDAEKPSAQIRWLSRHGWPFEVSAKKRPKVLRSVAVARMGGNMVGAVNTGPNWEALDGAA